MRTLSIILFVFSFAVLGVVAPCRAAQDNWEYVMAMGYTMSADSSTLRVGISPTSVDGYDSADMASSMDVVNLSAYRTSADGWTGPDGFYFRDIRSPFTTNKTWDNIYMWWLAGSRLDNQPLRFYPVSNPDIPPPPNYVLTLYLDYVPTGVTYNGPWSWQLPNDSTLTIPAGTFTPFASETGLDGYKFHLTVTNVPEPSSLLALLGCLGSVGVTLLQRRK